MPVVDVVAVFLAASGVLTFGQFLALVGLNFSANAFLYVLSKKREER